MSKAYRSGYEAYCNGGGVSANPYTKRSTQHKEWLVGFRAAADLDE